MGKPSVWIGAYCNVLPKSTQDKHYFIISHWEFIWMEHLQNIGLRLYAAILIKLHSLILWSVRAEKI